MTLCRTATALRTSSKAEVQLPPGAISDTRQMRPEEVFLAKRCDLAGRSFAVPQSPAYELLMAAPLLRELLIGEPPLVHLVNRTPRLPIRFAVNLPRPPWELDDRLAFMRETTTMSVHDGLDPEDVEGDRQTLELDRFLKVPVMYDRSRVVTIYDTVEWAANSAGAVHFGATDKKNREAVAAVADAMDVGSAEAPTAALAPIGRIVVRATADLADHLGEPQD
jgi:hypothetical protein